MLITGITLFVFFLHNCNLRLFVFDSSSSGMYETIEKLFMFIKKQKTKLPRQPSDASRCPEPTRILTLAHIRVLLDQFISLQQGVHFFAAGSSFLCSDDVVSYKIQNLRVSREFYLKQPQKQEP